MQERIKSGDLCHSGQVVCVLGNVSSWLIKFVVQCRMFPTPLISLNRHQATAHALQQTYNVLLKLTCIKNLFKRKTDYFTSRNAVWLSYVHRAACLGHARWAASPSCACFLTHLKGCFWHLATLPVTPPTVCLPSKKKKLVTWPSLLCPRPLPPCWQQKVCWSEAMPGILPAAQCDVITDRLSEGSSAFAENQNRVGPFSDVIWKFAIGIGSPFPFLPDEH